jgi:hypothetical protein
MLNEWKHYVEVPLYQDDVMQFLIQNRKTTKNWSGGKPYVRNI